MTAEHAPSDRVGLDYPMKYLPDLGKRPPTLTSAQTRIPLPTTRRRRSGPHLKTDVRESMEFWSLAGAAANVCMQLAWPEVGYGVMESRVESGALMKHPWKRGRTTLQYLTVAILGTDEEKAAYREAINSQHRHVKSDANSPVKYNAFDRELQLWVASCLYVGVEDTHQMLHGVMDPDELDTFYQTGKCLGTTLQVPPEMWPATRADFEIYWNTASERIHIDPAVAAFLNKIIGLKMLRPVVGIPFAPSHRFLTTGFLPPIVREQLGLRWTPAEQKAFEAMFTGLAAGNRFLPRPVRFAATNALMGEFRWRINHNKDLV